MRNFLIANGYGTSEGNVSIHGLKDGVFSQLGNDITNFGVKDYKEFQLILHRSAENGGDVVLPIYPNNFSYSVMEDEDATKFRALFTVPAPTYIGDYSIIIIKKGIGFNERNKWTATVHVSDTSITAEQLSELLINAINSNSEASGVTAQYVDEEEATGIRIIADSFDDYEVKGADKLFGVEAQVDTTGFKGLLTPAHVKDLLDKAAADVGYEYTYTDGLDKLYPGYFGANSSISEVNWLYTLRFAEPRQVRTVDHEINQIVQIALKTDNDNFSKILNAFGHKASGLASDI